MPNYQRCRLILVGLATFVLLVAGCGGAGSSRPSPPQAIQPARQPPLSVRARPAQVQYLGDLDGDGRPTVGDAIKILRIVVGLDPYKPHADANQNGGTDVGDAIKVLRCVVGLDEWPIAVEACSISGKVKTWDTHAGLWAATIFAEETAQRVRTDTDGNYTISELAIGTYHLVASKKGYEKFGIDTQTVSLTETNRNATGIHFAMAQLPPPPESGGLNGFVVDAERRPAENVEVSVNGGTDTTDSNGEYLVWTSPGSQTVTPRLSGHTFSPPSRPVTVVTGQITHVEDFTRE